MRVASKVAAARRGRRGTVAGDGVDVEHPPGSAHGPGDRPAARLLLLGQYPCGNRECARTMVTLKAHMINSVPDVDGTV